MMAVDLDAGKIWLGANGVWWGSGALPETGSNVMMTIAGSWLGQAFFPGLSVTPAGSFGVEAHLSYGILNLH